MAVMRSTRTLWDAPFGNPIENIAAIIGSKVQIIETDPPWAKIELLDHDNDPKPQGWVDLLEIDADADVLQPLDSLLFAKVCVTNAENRQIQPHYMLSVADMRTSITDGPNTNGVDYGPFALSTFEWKVFGSLPQFNIEMKPRDIELWGRQCVVFAAATLIMQKRFANLLANQPTAAQLALAQMIGTGAALRAVHAPHRPVMDIVNDLPKSELEAEGVDRARLPIRYADFLANKTAGESLEAVTESLQASLDKTRPFITQAAAEYIEFATDLAKNVGPSAAFFKAEVIANKTVKYHAPDGSTLIRKGGSRSWRKFNPGNISKGNFSKSQGAIGAGPKFAIFPDETTGFQAILALLTGEKYGGLTLSEAMHRYAPPSENDTQGYIAKISNKAGISPDEVLNSLSKARLGAMARVIQEHEGWIPGTETRTAATLPTPGLDVSAAAIASAANKEWEHWGGSTWSAITGVKDIKKTEKSAGYAAYVYDNYYLAIISSPLPRKQMIDRIAETATPHYAWSALTVSYIMKNAGFSRKQFKFSAAHHVYIRKSVADKKDKNMSATYWGYRIGDVAPEVGDIVGAAGWGNVPYDEAQAYYDRTDNYTSHADIVVDVRSGEIDVIGGNVSESVTKKTLRTNAKGILVDKTFSWFVVMKRRLPS